MEQKITCIKTGIVALLLIASTSSMVWGQNVLYEENMGTPTANTPVQFYKGWQDTGVFYTGDGTCDVRNSSASTGYGGASGGGNIMINDTVKWFQISGINTSEAVNTTVKLNCGVKKTNAENGSHLRVEFSTDSIIWTSLEMADTLPTGTGTSGWHRVCFPNLPVHQHLHIRFSSSVNVDFRIDDIRITDGDEIVLETVATPTCSPSAGTYYEPQTILLECSTPNSTIRYTLDGSTPTSQSSIYSVPLTISTNCKLKAFAESENMYNSDILTARFSIIDTNSVVTLPFDISQNSETGKVEVKSMPGFREVKLGTSYADGGAKFESKNAGQATLTAHLDSAPEGLMFDLKGTKGGTSSSYSGILFVVSESADGTQWSTVATLDETDISTESYTRHGSFALSQDSRYIRWFLATASSGNTQLNNIIISKRQESNDNGIASLNDTPESVPYPNPAERHFQWNICDLAAEIMLYDMGGNLISVWMNVQPGDKLNVEMIPPGCYLLKAVTPIGRITKKLLIK